MKKIPLKIRLLTGLLTGGMILSTSITSFAATTKTSNPTVKAPSKIEYTQPNIKTQQDSNFKKLVSSKILTQNQVNKIKAVLIKAETANKSEFNKTKAMTEKQRKIYKSKSINPLKSLVDNGTITQSQADKIGFGGHGINNHNGSNKPMTVQNVK